MKHPIIAVLLFLIISTLQAQEDTSKLEIDKFINRFNSKMDTVFWLCEYDNIAWWTSDKVSASSEAEQAKLGPQWFCFKQDDLWHAAYGKFTDGQYDLVFHYTVDSSARIKRIHIEIDTFTTNSFCRSLIKGSDLLSQYLDGANVNFNPYIQRNKDSTISVWYMPAFTQNGTAVYGGEFYYLFDASGNHVLSKSEKSYGYKGFKPDRKAEIWLDYSFVDEPTLGAVFFVWYYRTYFDRIIIDAKNYKSSVFHNNSGYYWVHAKKN